MSNSILRRAAASGVHRIPRLAIAGLALSAAFGLAQAPAAENTRSAALPQGEHVVRLLQNATETLELTVNTSRILTTGKELPRVMVHNPEVAEVTPLSPTHVQILAKKPGVTQINLFDADDGIHSVDLIVLPDARELLMLLRTQFPTAALKVVPTSNSVIISGYVDDPTQVQRIIDMATDYAPKVLNNIRVGGVQQVLLQVKVMEVSRTKLRNFGFDWGTMGRPGQGFAVNGVGQLLNTAGAAAGGAASGGASTALGTLTAGTAQNLNFGVLSGSNAFFGVMNLLTQKNVAKVVAEPQLVTVSGRPASFHVGGSVPYPSQVSLAGPRFSFMQIGTQIDFVPIVLGGGAIRLEVRPRVSEKDPSNSVTYAGNTIPGFRERQCDTGVELRSGQTLALAGLVQQRVETASNGLAWISEFPILGMPFRNMGDNYNEIETLIMVTPHLVDAMDAHQVPPGGPGYATADPDNYELYCRGHVEVPNCNGPAMLGPYPDANGVFPAPTGETWDEPVADPKKQGGQPAEKAAAGPADGPSPGGQPKSGFAPPPKPPTFGPEKTVKKTVKRSTAGFVGATGHEPLRRDNPTVKPGLARQKKTPGFIGPTGYDLR